MMLKYIVQELNILLKQKTVIIIVTLSNEVDYNRDLKQLHNFTVLHNVELWISYIARLIMQTERNATKHFEAIISSSSTPINRTLKTCKFRC